VVITGNTAIVGIETVRKTDDNQLAQYKRDIETLVKETDAGIDHVTVTAAEDLVERIDKMADGASKRGDYPAEYDDKIKEIVKSIGQ
jgi:hypothetical protein